MVLLSVEGAAVGYAVGASLVGAGLVGEVPEPASRQNESRPVMTWPEVDEDEMLVT